MKFLRRNDMSSFSSVSAFLQENEFNFDLFLWLQKPALFPFSLAFLIPSLLLVMKTSAVAGEKCVSLEQESSTYNLDDAVSYYEDQTTNLSLQNILEAPSNSWTCLPGSIPSFGFSSSAYWLKINICPTRQTEERAVLEINYPLLDSVALYAITGQTIIYKAHTGDRIPFSQRPEKYRNFVFFLPDAGQEILTLYLRVQTESAVQIPLQLYRSTSFFKHNQRVLFVQGGYFGIILAMMLYNTILFFLYVNGLICSMFFSPSAISAFKVSCRDFSNNSSLIQSGGKTIPCFFLDSARFCLPICLPTLF